MSLSQDLGLQTLAKGIFWQDHKRGPQNQRDNRESDQVTGTPGKSMWQKYHL